MVFFVHTYFYKQMILRPCLHGLSAETILYSIYEIKIIKAITWNWKIR